MRKSINGLSLMVKESFELDPFDRSLFVFCDRRKTKIKILTWDQNGFWLYYKRLERGHFPWPTMTGQSMVQVSETLFHGLLEGIPWLKSQEI